MRLEAVQRDVKTSGTLEVAKATIKATPKIFDMFADQTYANKPVAITRELVANAVDAHIAAGKPDVPVEVTLPTALDPMFKVKDSGIGMSHEFVMGPFMAYTDGSTKDQDDKQIGGFGIGSKSPFAYTDQFTLRVVHEGILSVYTMFKDDTGIPAIGLQAQTTTDELNGVEVSFPVEDADQETFRNAAQQALQYFRPLPVVVNGEIKPPTYSYTGKNWALRETSGELGVIMGGVRYPVSENNLEWTLRNDTKLSPLLKYGIDITLPIGAVPIAMSREQLSYTPVTTKAIKDALLSILDEVIDTFATYFDHAKTEWEAMVLLGKETRDTWSNARAQLMRANARYKGVPLKTTIEWDYNDRKKPLGEVWYIPHHRTVGGVIKWEAIALRAIAPQNISDVIVDDLPIEPKSRTVARIKYHFENNPRTSGVLVLRAPGKNTDKKAIKAMLQLIKNPPNVVYTSTLPVPPKQIRVANGTRPRVRMFTFTGARNHWTHSLINNLTPAHSKRNIVVEVKGNDQPTSGIMVVMKNFDLPDDFHKKMETGVIKFDELIFVNEGDAPKIKSMFKNFEDVFKERFAKAAAAYPELPQRLAVAKDAHLSELFGEIRLHRSKIALTDPQKKRPFGKIVELWDRYVKPLTDDQRMLAPMIEAKLPTGVKPEALLKAFETRQPDAKLLLGVLDLRKETHLALFLRNV